MKKTLRNIFFNSIAFLCCFISCKKDAPPEKLEVSITGGNNLVYVANEGNFNFNNSSIIVHDPSSGVTSSDIYKPNNNNQSLGDICQSLSIIQNELYAVVNNSQKITVIDLNTYQKKAEIQGFLSPRYILNVSNNKVYVSNLKLNYSNNQIQIFNPTSKTITGSISCKGWIEKMILSYGKVFASSPTSKFIYVFDSASDQLTDSIQVGYGSSAMIKDKDEKIWVSFSGDSLNGQYPGIAKINPLNNQLENVFYFSNFVTIQDLQTNSSGDALFFIRNHVFKMDINAGALPTSPLINSSGNNFYSLGVDPNRNELYISDALTYIQNGVIFVHDLNGNYIRQFQAGIIPGYFLFKS